MPTDGVPVLAVEVVGELDAAEIRERITMTVTRSTSRGSPAVVAAVADWRRVV